ncbi:hypothetical protein NDU88_009406 [Pleurodeles waltl]|uniref:Uncharacterized protein n=1 Tax=Pleurodeles waltl TaxID=8319 RepID=A0AAV7S0A5_PLEWA|nr:hypothetical protein NDU88_009406 [Pleurodeles waltl]
MPALRLGAARFCRPMSLSPGLSLLREAGRGVETNSFAETPRLSVLCIRFWAEAACFLHRERRCHTLCCFRGPHFAAAFCASRKELEKEPQVHSKPYSAITVGDNLFMSPVKLRARASRRGPALARKQKDHCCTGEGEEAP